MHCTAALLFAVLDTYVDMSAVDNVEDDDGDSDVDSDGDDGMCTLTLLLRIASQVVSRTAIKRFWSNIFHPKTMCCFVFLIFWKCWSQGRKKEISMWCKFIWWNTRESEHTIVAHLKNKIMSKLLKPTNSTFAKFVMQICKKILRCSKEMGAQNFQKKKKNNNNNKIKNKISLEKFWTRTTFWHLQPPPRGFSHRSWLYLLFMAVFYADAFFFLSAADLQSVGELAGKIYSSLLISHF